MLSLLKGDGQVAETGVGYSVVRGWPEQDRLYWWSPKCGMEPEAEILHQPSGALPSPEIATREWTGALLTLAQSP